MIKPALSNKSFSVTLVSSRTQPKRVTCKRLGRLRKDGSGYTGMLGLLERNVSINTEKKLVVDIIAAY